MLEIKKIHTSTRIRNLKGSYLIALWIAKIFTNVVLNIFLLLLLGNLLKTVNIWYRSVHITGAKYVQGYLMIKIKTPLRTLLNGFVFSCVTLSDVGAFSGNLWSRKINIVSTTNEVYEDPEPLLISVISYFMGIWTSARPRFVWCSSICTEQWVKWTPFEFQRSLNFALNPFTFSIFFNKICSPSFKKNHIF